MTYVDPFFFRKAIHVWLANVNRAASMEEKCSFVINPEKLDGNQFFLPHLFLNLETIW